MNKHTIVGFIGTMCEETPYGHNSITFRPVAKFPLKPITEEMIKSIVEKIKTRSFLPQEKLQGDLAKIMNTPFVCFVVDAFYTKMDKRKTRVDIFRVYPLYLENFGPIQKLKKKGLFHPILSLESKITVEMLDMFLSKQFGIPENVIKLIKANSLNKRKADINQSPINNSFVPQKYKTVFQKPPFEAFEKYNRYGIKYDLVDCEESNFIEELNSVLKAIELYSIRNKGEVNRIKNYVALFGLKNKFEIESSVDSNEDSEDENKPKEGSLSSEKIINDVISLYQQLYEKKKKGQYYITSQDEGYHDIWNDDLVKFCKENIDMFFIDIENKIISLKWVARYISYFYKRFSDEIEDIYFVNSPLDHSASCGCMSSLTSYLPKQRTKKSITVYCTPLSYRKFFIDYMYVENGLVDSVVIYDIREKELATKGEYSDKYDSLFLIIEKIHLLDYADIHDILSHFPKISKLFLLGDSNSLLGGNGMLIRDLKACPLRNVKLVNPKNTPWGVQIRETDKENVSLFTNVDEVRITTACFEEICPSNLVFSEGNTLLNYLKNMRKEKSNATTICLDKLELLYDFLEREVQVKSIIKFNVAILNFYNRKKKEEISEKLDKIKYLNKKFSYSMLNYNAVVDNNLDITKFTYVVLDISNPFGDKFNLICNCFTRTDYEKNDGSPVNILLGNFEELNEKAREEQLDFETTRVSFYLKDFFKEDNEKKIHNDDMEENLADKDSKSEDDQIYTLNKIYNPFSFTTQEIERIRNDNGKRDRELPESNKKKNKRRKTENHSDYDEEGESEVEEDDDVEEQDEESEVEEDDDIEEQDEESEVEEDDDIEEQDEESEVERDEVQNEKQQKSDKKDEPSVTDNASDISFEDVVDSKKHQNEDGKHFEEIPEPKSNNSDVEGCEDDFELDDNMDLFM